MQAPISCLKWQVEPVFLTTPELVVQGPGGVLTCSLWHPPRDSPRVREEALEPLVLSDLEALGCPKRPGCPCFLQTSSPPPTRLTPLLRRWQVFHLWSQTLPRILKANKTHFGSLVPWPVPKEGGPQVTLQPWGGAWAGHAVLNQREERIRSTPVAWRPGPPTPTPMLRHSAKP